MKRLNKIVWKLSENHCDRIDMRQQFADGLRRLPSTLVDLHIDMRYDLPKLRDRDTAQNPFQRRG